MAQNFNHFNTISSVGLGLGNETIGVRLFPSPTDPNLGMNRVIGDGGLIDSNLGLGELGLISHGVMELKKTMVQLDHSFIDYTPLQNRHAFPLTDVTVTEFVKTTRFLTSISTTERLLASSQIVSNQGILPTQPNQVINPLLSQNPSMYQAALNILNHGREAVCIPPSAYPYNQGLSFDPTAAISQNLNTLSKPIYNMNQERGPSYVNPVVRVPSNQAGVPSHYENQPMIHGTTLELEVADENNDEYPWGNDGRTHSVRDNPEGAYGCPVCSAAFPTSQTFAAHVKIHYRQESKEATRRRMAAKYRRKDLRVVRSSLGLTAMPGASFKGRNNGKSNIEILEEAVSQGLGLDTLGEPVENGPFHGVIIKQEPI